MKEFKIDFIGIGANKAGTSWVNKILSAHPQICTAEPKEVHFFHDRKTFTRATHAGNFPKGLSWYKRFFKHCPNTKIKGEITPMYMVDEKVPARIKNIFPDVKIILCLRSPIERATSQYHFERYFNRRESRPMRQALQQEPNYIENGLYYQALQRYLDYFPLSSIHLIWFEDIKQKPKEVASSLYAFLGVSADFEPASLHKKENVSRRAKLKWLTDFLANGERAMTSAGLASVVQWIKILKINKLIAYFNTAPLEYSQPTVEDRAWMQDQFREDILRLQEFTGRDLSSWLA